MKIIPLPHFNERPECAIDTIVIHSIYAPQSLDAFSYQACIDLLDHHKVSSHYLIERDGGIIKCIEEDVRAWHAGASKMPAPDDQRIDVNNFSIGIELIASETSGYTNEQYEALAQLTREITSRHPVKTVIGHDSIAPGRKIDPGPLFSWSQYEKLVGDKALTFWKS